MSRIYQWAELTSPELATLAVDDPVAVLPVAAIEQHGAHLPLATDVLIGNGLLASACKMLDSAPGQPIVCLPGCVLGASLEHAEIAGTLSLSAEQAIAQIVAIGEGVARAGIRRLVLFNSHGGNKAILDLAALELRAGCGLLVVKANYFRFAPPADLLPAAELAHGLHGGALETSMLWHLAPDAVRVDALADHPSLGQLRAEDGHTLGPEGDAGFAWLARDLHPSGVTGNARLASAAIGARLVAHFAARLSEIVAETAAFDLQTLAATRGT